MKSRFTFHVSRLTFHALLLLLLALSLSAQTITTTTVTVTNTAGTTNGQTIVLNGSTRTWTNAVYVSANQILTNSASTGAATNLFNHLALNPVGGGATIAYGSSTSIVVRGYPAQVLTITISDGWGDVTSTTNVLTSARTVRVPATVEAAGPRAEIQSQLVTGINDYSTNSFFENSISVSNLVGRTNTQTITGAKTFSSTSGVWNGTITNSPGITGTFGAVSNGIWWDGILRAPTLTNAANYGNAFRSPGSGSGSEQFGSSAAASGGSSVALGASTTASADETVAIGYASTASAAGGTAIGSAAEATAPSAIAIGGLAAASGTNSVAIGYAAAASANNQVVLGSSSHHVSIPGGLFVGGSATNLPVVGYLSLDGNARFIRKANSALANGNNAAVDISTNTFVEVSGPTAIFTINGIANGSDGRYLVIVNQTGYAMTIANDSGVDPVAGNRIYTLSGADRTIGTSGSATLIYSAAASRWLVLATSNETTAETFPFVSMHIESAETVSMPAAAYTQITNYDYVVSSGFSTSLANGTMTNQTAGYYLCMLQASFTGGNAVAYEAEFFTNTVACDAIAFERTMGASAAIGSASAVGIIYLPASCRVDFRIKNDGGTADVTMEKLQLVLRLH